MIRFLDITLSLIGITLLSSVYVLLYIIGLFDTGSPIFSQKRLGLNEELFTIYKFRSMQTGTPNVGTDEVDKTKITILGRYLRGTKLDELPQLLNVLRGDMSIVGPRPCLPVQLELIELRRKANVFSVRPGITGLAQITNVDMSDPMLLTKLDAQLIGRMSILCYLRFIFATFFSFRNK